MADEADERFVPGRRAKEPASGSGRWAGLVLCSVALALFACSACMAAYGALQNVHLERRIRRLEERMRALEQLGPSSPETPDGGSSAGAGLIRNAEAAGRREDDDRRRVARPSKDGVLGVFQLSAAITDPDAHYETSDVPDQDEDRAPIRNKRSSNNQRRNNRKDKEMEVGKKRKKQKRGKGKKSKAKSASLTVIHLEGGLEYDRTAAESLQRDTTFHKDHPELDGRLTYHGFVPNRENLAFWRQASWSNSSKSRELYTFNQTEGSVTVKQSGIYFVYAQVHFQDTAAYLGYHVKRTPADGSGQHPALSCYTGADPLPDHRGRHQSCASGGLVHVAGGDSVSLHLLSYATLIDATRSLSYWGMIRMSSGGG